MNRLWNHTFSLKAIIGLGLLVLTHIAALGQAPQAVFSQDKTQGCVPLIVNFTDNSSGNIKSWYWDFGNGNTSVLQNPGAVYGKAGVFTLKLIVTDINGKQDSVIKTTAVTAFANPIAEFTATPQLICKNDEVNFTFTGSQTTNPIISYAWNFGDGEQSNTKNPNHTYKAEGTFAVSLVVTDNLGCRNVLNKPGFLQVSEPPKVDFTSDVKGGCKTPLNVNFTNATPPITGKTHTYFWDFGNGQTSTQQNPAHTYQNNGNYNVSLRVSDNQGCTKTLLRNNYIIIGKTAANFDATPKLGCAPLKVNFGNNSTGAPLDAKYVWYFGNGDSSVGYSPAYTYYKPGKYTVKLKITSPGGCNDIIEKTDFIDVLPAPAFDFTYSDSVICESPMAIQFATNNPAIRAIEWDFGDSGKSTQPNPAWLYKKSGIFTVSLTATFANGCVVTKTKKDLINVNPLKAFFSVSDTSGCVPLSVTFTNKSTATFGINKYEWDFGDGLTSNLANPTHTYTVQGRFYPQLTITDSKGCTRTYIYNYIQAGLKANPDFVADKREGCKQDMRNVRFTNLTDISKVQVDYFIWVTGMGKEKVLDTSFFTVDYKEKKFNKSPDSITIKLITYSRGCYDTIEKKNYIVLHPPDVRVDFTIDNCKLDTITFTNTSFGADVFDWSLNGVPIADKKQFKKFLLPGKHLLEASGTHTANNCKDNRSYTITILPPLMASILMNNQGICAGDSVIFSLDTNNTERLIFDYLWILNGKPESNKRSFTKLFKSTDSIDVKLTIIDGYGCVKDTTLYGLVNVGNSSINAGAYPNKGCYPLLSNLIIKTPLNNLINPRWKIYGQTIPATGDTLPFVFDKMEPGMNTLGIPVLFEAEDSTGCTLKKELRVHLSHVEADFATTPSLGCNKTDLNFFSSSKLLMAYGGLKYDWQMDDTLPFTSAVNKYTFTGSGSHTLRLQLKDSVLGCSAEVIKPFDIKVRKLKAGFTVNNTAISCPPLATIFTDDSKTENTVIDNVQWWFGDSSSSTHRTPIKNYFFPGNFDIKYRIADITGCSDSILIPGIINVGGPHGTMNVDRYQGCEPLFVNYHVTNPSTPNVKWDFGDGTIFTGLAGQNQYTRPGTFYPHMVLEDSMGCVVFYPSKQPLVIHPSPKPSFTVNGVCLYDNFTFTNTTNTASPQSFVWKFGTGDSIFGKNVQYKYTNPGTYTVELSAKSQNGCKTSAFNTVYIPTLNAAFEPANKFACLSQAVALNDKSIAGVGIQTWEWHTSDGRILTGNKPQIIYSIPGQYNTSLIIKDKNGCFDTAINAQNLTVFDTLPPAVPAAFRVTVEENNTLRFEYAKYKQPDFGAYVIYKAKAGELLQLYKEITTPTDTVYIDNAVNPDDFAYTYKIVNRSFCGRYSDQLASIPQTSILLKGQLDTNLLHINWSHYKGWDKVRYYHIYRKAPGDIKFTKIDTVLGSVTNYTDTNAYCDAVYKYYVMAEEEAPQPLFSRSNTISLRPYHKLTVLPGTIVRATVEEDKNILIEFEGPKTHRAPVVAYILQKSWDGRNYETAISSPSCCPSYLDKNVDVHQQSYYYRLQCMDVCADVSMPGNIGKSILLKAHINTDENVQVDWSAYQHWDTGINNYQLEFKKPDGTYQKAANNNFNDTDYIDETGTYNTVANICYRVKATSNAGVVSYSNTDCVKGRSSLFVPNAFSPNGDGDNDKFDVVGAYIKTYKIQIFTRWGEWVYTSYSLQDSWNGIFKDKTVHDQVYVYVIEAIGMDSKQYNLRGNITVLN